MNNFRKLAFEKIVQNANFSNNHKSMISPKGYNVKKISQSLTDFVRKDLSLEKKEKHSDFKEKFLKMRPGPEREQLVFEEIVKRKPLGKLVPITIDGPNGMKITYEVMPDYITIDGLRVPMSGRTAQRVVNHFNMILPTPTMVDQIWNHATIQIRPPPLSGGGQIGDRYFSGKEVVESKIADSDSAVAYSNMIEQEIINIGKEGLVAGHMKDLIMPQWAADKLGLYGWHGTTGKPLEPSKQTSHDTLVHTEYGAGVRMISKKVHIVTANGRVIETTMEKMLNDDDLYRAISKVKGFRKYKL